MKYTNPSNFHPSLEAICKLDNYVPGRPGSISVSTLINPPQIDRLKQQHWGEITIPVDRRLWAVFGSAVHHLLEQAGEGIKEERLYATIDDREVSAQIDIWRQGELTDFKVTSTWSYIFGHDTWNQQLQVQRWLCKQNGIDVDTIQNVLIFKDWSRHKMPEKGYPSAVSVTVRYTIWDDERVETFIRARLALHKLADTRCTDEDRWARGEAWACKKLGNKRATKVFDNAADAFAWVKDKNAPLKYDDYFVDHRPPEYVRCDHFCDVAAFCQQHKETKNAT